MPYPDDWRTRREYVYERAGYRCQNCGTPGRETELHAHHIVPEDKGGTHHLSNLACLCKECHGAAHDWGDERETETTLVDADREDVDFIAVNDLRGADLDIEIGAEPTTDPDEDSTSRTRSWGQAPDPAPPEDSAEPSRPSPQSREWTDSATRERPKQPMTAVMSVHSVSGSLKVSIPKEIAEVYGIEDGDELYWLDAGEYLRVEKYQG